MPLSQRVIKIITMLVIGSISAAFLVVSLMHYNLGTLARMGPGYYPALVASALAVVAVFSLIFDDAKNGSGLDFSGRPFIFILLSILLFAWTVDRFGLVPAVISTVFISSLSLGSQLVFHTFLLALFISLMAWLIFHVGLGMPIQPFKWPL